MTTMYSVDAPYQRTVAIDLHVYRYWKLYYYMHSRLHDWPSSNAPTAATCEMVIWSPSLASGFLPGTPISSHKKGHSHGYRCQREVEK